MDEEREEIVAVLVRYARAIDTKDWELLHTCFTADAACDYGPLGSWPGADDLVVFMEEAHAGMGPTQHLLSNFQIEVDGDRASSLTYVHATPISRTPRTGTTRPERCPPGTPTKGSRDDRRCPRALRTRTRGAARRLRG